MSTVDNIPALQVSLNFHYSDRRQTSEKKVDNFKMATAMLKKIKNGRRRDCV
jgi:hypothetical protein